MKLYVKDRKNSSKKVYLPHEAATRNQLADIIGSNFFRVEGEFYSIEEVLAEEDKYEGLFGSVIGVALGLFTLGPIGAAAGFLGGSLFGSKRQQDELLRVVHFNKSSIINAPVQY